MLEVLTFYTSSFWVWAGITIGLATVINGTAAVVAAIIASKGE